MIGMRVYLKEAPKFAGRSSRNFAYLNFYFSAWLNSFYTWIQFYEHNKEEEFVKLKTKYYNAYLEYRLTYNLRMAATHSQSVINIWKYDVIADKSKFLIGVHHLLESRKHMQSIFCKELDMLKETISEFDTFEIVQKMEDILQKFQNELYESMCSDTSKALADILDVLPNDIQDLYNTELEEQEGTEQLNLGQIVLNFIRDACSIYPDFLPKSITNQAEKVCRIIP